MNPINTTKKIFKTNFKSSVLKFKKVDKYLSDFDSSVFLYKNMY